MQADIPTSIEALMTSQVYADLRAVITSEHERTVSEIIALTETPSPPFKEQRRAERFLAMLQAQGLPNARFDEIGNVLARRDGTGPGVVIVAAHLDTVFPEGTPIAVRREGTRLHAPGIGDDTRGLAVLLAFVRALAKANVETAHSILFVGDVGEEGLGDLRGMRHLFASYSDVQHVRAFITVDSPHMDPIVTGGVGSRRYQVTFTGPGGHSYNAHGAVNPIYAMSEAITRIGRLQVPNDPKTTFCVATVAGGDSVNSIPSSCAMKVDLRSHTQEGLDALDAQVLQILNDAVSQENAARNTQAGKVQLEIKPIGNRPAGHTPHDSVLVQACAKALHAHDIPHGFGFSSTDANVPMSLGIPAVRLGSGGSGGRAHTVHEWIDVEPVESCRGMLATLTAILCVAGIKI